MLTFFKTKAVEVRNKLRYQITDNDLNLLHEIAEAINYIRINDPASGKLGGERKNPDNRTFLKDLEGCFFSAFMQYDAGEGGPFYRFYREKVSSQENSFRYSGERKEKDWYIQRHDGVVGLDDTDFELKNVSEIFEKILRPILNGEKQYIAKDSRVCYLLNSLKESKKHIEEGRRWLVTEHMHLSPRVIATLPSRAGSVDGLSVAGLTDEASSSGPMRRLS